MYTLSGWAVNLKYRVCNKIIAATTAKTFDNESLNMI
jgi:hypothetical protein